MVHLVALLLLLSPVSAPPLVADDLDLETLLRMEGQVREILPEAVRKTVAIRVQVRGQTGFGSGAHIGDGYILTCAHVVEYAEEEGLRVVLADGSEHDATRLGMNGVNDYALIRIEERDFPAFDLGDSAVLEGGEWVAALGHPGGPYPDSKPAFSLGQVTGTGVKLPLLMAGKQYTQAIRTNAQIFAGNSGGPLFDLDGRLLGLNGAILLINENAYAIPIHQILPDLDDLKDGDDVEGEEIEDIMEAMRELQEEFPPEEFFRMFKIPGLEDLYKLYERYLGEEDRTSPIPIDNRARLGIEIPRIPVGGTGIPIARVQSGGGAARAGLKAGDRILAIDKEKISSARDLQKILGRHEPGDQVTVNVSREGWEKEFKVTLQE